MQGASRFLKKRWALAAIFSGMLAGMTLFEITKQLFIPEISIWESHVLTILFTSVIGVALAYYPIREMQRENLRAAGEIRLRTDAEEKLRTSEAQIRSFVDTTESSIYTVDTRGDYLLMNRQHVSRLHIPEGKIEGHGYGDCHNREETEHFLTIIRKVTKENCPYSEELEKDTRTFLRQFNPVNDSHTGDVIAITVISQEITEQKRTERAILEANRKLNLLSDITRHDILNQLLVLNGYIALLRGHRSSPDDQEFLSRCDTAVRNIQSQISFTRDYQDIGIQAPEWQNIGGILARVQQRLNLCRVLVEDTTGNVEILADHLLEKVFYNLVDNSLRYAGPRLSSIKVCPDGELPDGSLRIVYSDNGEGISANDRSRLFERGFGKHTGLGLFLSREILSITGITITETGTPGTGVRFEIVVPKGGFRFSRTENKGK